MEGYFRDGGVDDRHLRPELPERIDEKDWVVPSVLAGTITCTRCLQMEILTYWRRYGPKLQVTSIWDEGEGYIRMVMVGDDSIGTFWYLIQLLGVSTMLERGRIIRTTSS